MGFFKRTADIVITHHDLVTTVSFTLDPVNRRVAKLQARGTPANGVITGIQFDENDATTHKEFAITVPQADGVVRFGIRTQPTQVHRLRLGLPVVARFDGKRGILDWEAMRAAWGLDGMSLSQESIRRTPDDGIVDNVLDARVQRRLKKWTRTEATITSLERRTAMGMSTENWDIGLRLPDGTMSMSSSDHVPSYAQWYTAPGTVVPAVVDPKKPTKASIDWPALALARVAAVSFDEDPPAGSIAAEKEGSGGAAATAVMGVGASPTSPSPTSPSPTSPSAGAPVSLDATMLAWVNAVRAGHMSTEDFESALADWVEAGMCDDAQVQAARTAVTA